MKKKAIKLAAAVLCLIFIFPQKVWGADINITYQTEETYDSTKLTYESESWSESAENANLLIKKK